MNNVVSLVLSFLIKENVISQEKETLDFYRYGIEISISSLLNIVLIILLGLITHHFIESIIFLIIFIFLRSFMGGYHATTYFRCNLLMCVSFLLLILLYELLNNYISISCSLITLVPIFIVVAIFCPVENVNKPISEKRKIKLKIISIIFCLVFAVVSITLILKSVKIGVMILFTMLLIAILIIAAKIKERGVLNEILKKKSC